MLSMQSRKAIFRALVIAQDNGMSIAESKAHIAEKFKITRGYLRQIEDEGVAKDWPPLLDAPVKLKVVKK